MSSLVYANHMDWVMATAMTAAVATLVTAVGGVVVSIKNFKVNKSTHKIVNQQRTDMLEFQSLLISSLNEHGIPIPKDKSKIDD